MTNNIHSCSPFCTLPACVDGRTRLEFEDSAKTHDLDLTPDDRDGGFYKSSETDYAWIFWQAATERATVIERERCAALCESRVYALDFAGKQYRREWTASQCAKAIRQGGAK